jgi:D-alanyl-D-alanine carboxypeptidase (penicillin-binding protein 5/6)
MAEACRHPLFEQIAGAFRTSVPATNFSSARDISSPALILSESSRYYYSYVTAARTSATYEGGYSLAASARKDDMTLIAVILGSVAVTLDDGSTQMRNLTQGKALFEWGFGNFAWRDVLSSGDLITEVKIEYGDGADSVLLRPAETIRLLLDNAIRDDDFTREVIVYSERDGVKLMAPVERGAPLGEIRLYLGGEIRGASRLVANTDVGLQRVRYLESQVRQALGSKWTKLALYVLFLLFATYIALVVRYNIKRRERLRRIKEAKRKIMEERRRDDAGFRR